MSERLDCVRYVLFRCLEQKLRQDRFTLTIQYFFFLLIEIQKRKNSKIIETKFMKHTVLLGRRILKFAADNTVNSATGEQCSLPRGKNKR